jgi:hypothetical protein
VAAGAPFVLFASNESCAAVSISALQVSAAALAGRTVSVVFEAPVAVAAWSAAGPAASGVRKPELVSPGEAIASAHAGALAARNGTSGAAAAGRALLGCQFFADGFHPSLAARPAGVRAVSGNAVRAVLLNAPATLVDGPRASHGIPNLTAGLDLGAVRLSDDEAIGSGGYHAFELTTKTAAALSVTLAYADAPSGRRTLAADLDLFVSRGAALWIGNMGAQEEELSTVEKIAFRAAPGTYTVHVFASDFPGAVIFSLAATGGFDGGWRRWPATPASAAAAGAASATPGAAPAARGSSAASARATRSRTRKT